MTQEPDQLQVGPAARAIARAAARLRPPPAGALVISRGEHDLWSELMVALRERGFDAVHQVWPATTRQWLPATPGELAELAGAGAVDLLVFHDPFGPATGAPGCQPPLLRQLTDSGVAVVFVEFPYGLREPRLRARTEAAYLRALVEPEAGMRIRADLIGDRLGSASAVAVGSGPGLELRVQGPWVVRTDWSSAELDVPVLQLPYGEFWIACDPDRVDGSFRYGQSTVVVRAGIPTGLPGRAGQAAEPLVEIGFGLNPRAPWLPGTCLAEKAHGHLHLGFGDNSLLGGSTERDLHYDAPLPLGTTAWTVGKDGGRARLT
jgi:hypothetical protein